MRIPRKDDPRKPPDYLIAAGDAGALAERATPELDAAVGVDWYELPGNEADRAAFTLCHLRRARAGEKGGPQHGDAAVRAALESASPEAVVWIASRAISYLDEHGFAEAVEPWVARDEDTLA